MSSVTRFLKQVNPAASHLNIGNLVSSAATVVYEFVPSAGNVVGNYPPGYVMTASAALIAQLALIAANNGAQCVVRDMGKSVRLPVATGGGSYGIRTLRKVQRITSASVTTTNDGVIATAAASPQYGVFYIVVGVNDDDGFRVVKWGSLNVPY